jgi:hypothetical protein
MISLHINPEQAAVNFVKNFSGKKSKELDDIITGHAGFSGWIENLLLNYFGNQALENIVGGTSNLLVSILGPSNIWLHSYKLCSTNSPYKEKGDWLHDLYPEVFPQLVCAQGIDRLTIQFAVLSHQGAIGFIEKDDRNKLINLYKSSKNLSEFKSEIKKHPVYNDFLKKLNGLTSYYQDAVLFIAMKLIEFVHISEDGWVFKSWAEEQVEKLFFDLLSDILGEIIGENTFRIKVFAPQRFKIKSLSSDNYLKPETEISLNTDILCNKDVKKDDLIFEILGDYHPTQKCYPEAIVLSVNKRSHQSLHKYPYLYLNYRGMGGKAKFYDVIGSSIYEIKEIQNTEYSIQNFNSKEFMRNQNPKVFIDVKEAGGDACLWKLEKQTRT